MNPINKVNQVRIASPLLSGLLYAFVMMAAGTLIVSLLLLWSNVQESSLPTYGKIVHGLSIFIGGWVAGKRSGSRGWYQGGILGALYAVTVGIVGFLAFDNSLNWAALALLGGAFAAGALGGMLGVNTRK
ncbi:TIGR04086 family membrane protein [Paenibacillus chartarius]|uniref:TIGR04086 family membrane protein n=1 Tax=Paenibacillus chartarius TaxID=747481 RepID=A0ABV6DIT6_9BACL